MKTLLRAAAAVLAAAICASASAEPAQPQRPNGGAQLGLGVGITSALTAPAQQGVASSPNLGVLLFVPVNLAQKIRIEPFLGWARSDTDGTGQDSDFTLGVGGFFVQPLATQLQLYAGARLGARWVSHRDPAFGAPNTEKRERRDTLLALAAGGEYLPIPRVALGAEFQVGYVSVGDTTTTRNGVSVVGGGGSGSATQGTLFARVYLF